MKRKSRRVDVFHIAYVNAQENLFVKTGWLRKIEWSVPSQGRTFLYRDESKSRLARDLDDRAQSRNVPVGTSDDLYRDETPGKYT